MDAPIEELSEALSLPEQIDAWLIALDAQGVKVDIEQRIRLNGLLLRLIAERRFPSDPNTLCRLVTPIVAGSPDQQTVCESTFKSILATKQKISTVDLRGDADSTRDDRNQNWGLPSWSVRAAAAGAIALTLLLGLYLALSYFPSGRENPPKPIPVTAITKLAMDVDWIKTYPIDELQPLHQAPWNRSLRWYHTEYGPEKWIALLLPWLIWVGFLGFLCSHLIAFLRREALRRNLQTLDLQLGNVNVQFGDRQLIAGLQPLRTLPRAYRQVLDAERTAIASAEAAGLLQPRFKKVAVSTDFVVLLDRRSGRDHLAAYNGEVVRTLRNAGLAIEILEFNRDPTLCHFPRTGEFASLDGVVRRFPDSVLLIFAAADQLVDPSYHQLLPAVSVLRDARHVVLLTPDVDPAKTPLESNLAKHLGISIARTTPAGLLELTSLLVPASGLNYARPPVSDVRHYSVAALLAFFAQRPGRWMLTVTPPRADRLQLLEHLRRILPPQILNWLTATAIYPELRWLLTLSLKRRIADAGQSGRIMDRDLLAISRLPWFRSGWMPDWVRGLLQQALSGREKHLVSRVILDAIGLRDRRVTPSAEDMHINLDEDYVERRELLKTDGIMLRYLLPLVQRSQRLFTLPESAVRRLMRKPLQRLAAIAAAAMLVAAATSFAALSLVPIDECDLQAASLYDNARIGPGNIGDMLSYPGYYEQALKACTEAVAREHQRAVAARRPENGRFLYQLSRIRPDTVGFAQAVQAAEMGYAAAYHSLGYDYYTGEGVQQNLDLAEKNYKRAIELGNVVSLVGLGDVARNRHDLQKAFDYYTAAVHAGEAETHMLAVFYRHSPNDLPSVPLDMKKSKNLLELGTRRGGGRSANALGNYWWENGEYAKADEHYELSIRLSPSGEAAANLASDCMRGLAGEPDYRKATYFAIFGAKLGNAQATDTLYELISSNHAVFKAGYGPPGSFEGIELVKLLAKSGGAEYQVKYAKILELGGNLTDARLWYSEAAKNGNSDAEDALKRLSH